MPFEPRKCPTCGTKFIPNRPHQIYCQPSCQKSRYIPKPKKNRTPRKCVICGVEFSPKFKAHNQIYCDKHKGMKIKSKLKPKIEKICLMCKESFLSPSKTREFCKPSCNRRFRTFEKRIFNLFWDEEEKEQLKLLNELGEGYRFPEPHENLNAFYELGRPKKKREKNE